MLDNHAKPIIKVSTDGRKWSRCQSSLSHDRNACKMIFPTPNQPPTNPRRSSRELISAQHFHILLPKCNFFVFDYLPMRRYSRDVASNISLPGDLVKYSHLHGTKAPFNNVYRISEPISFSAKKPSPKIISYLPSNSHGIPVIYPSSSTLWLNFHLVL